MWHCWWSLSAYLYRQHKSKKEGILHFYTHIPLLLTYFHLYWKFWHITGIYTGNKRKVSKRHFQRRCKGARGGRSPTHEHNSGWPTSPQQSRPIWQPAARSRGRGGPAQARARPPVPPPWPGLLVSAALTQGLAVQECAGEYSPLPNRLTKPYIKRGRGTLTHTHHTHLSSTSTSPLLTLLA
jgi:hypothetical protein